MRYRTAAPAAGPAAAWLHGPGQRCLQERGGFTLQEGVHMVLRLIRLEGLANSAMLSSIARPPSCAPSGAASVLLRSTTGRSRPGRRRSAGCARRVGPGHAFVDQPHCSALVAGMFSPASSSQAARVAPICRRHQGRGSPRNATLTSGMPPPRHRRRRCAGHRPWPAQATAQRVALQAHDHRHEEMPHGIAQVAQPADEDPAGGGGRS